MEAEDEVDDELSETADTEVIKQVALIFFVVIIIQFLMIFRQIKNTLWSSPNILTNINN